jgi:hypothetical protein
MNAGTSVAEWLRLENNGCFQCYNGVAQLPTTIFLKKMSKKIIFLLLPIKILAKWFRNQKVPNGIILLRCRQIIFFKKVEV